MFICDSKHNPIAIMPLQGTVVNANVSGFGAKVTVRQTFTNSSTTPVEALYTFPLPNDASVNWMRLKIGSRVIEGQIKLREEARRVYDEARMNGQTAALLDQERANIFTQSVANIMPGSKVEVEIGYVQVVGYDGGQFEFKYPMVVGPRFITGQSANPDKVSPPTLAPKVRSGANIDLRVHLDAGAPIRAWNSVLHEVRFQQSDDSHAEVTLKSKDEIPNRDFILRYQVATESVKSAFWSHYDAAKGGFFTLALLPPKRPTSAQISSKEVFFVMDQSGSQNGFPIEKSKELTLKLIDKLRPGDTFNVEGFNTVVKTLWDNARPNTPSNVAAARNFVRGMSANSGTHVLEGCVAALNAPADPRRLRIVLFNTDGYVDNEDKIIRAIRLGRGNARMFTFGIGNSVNRYLIDAMSEEGRGAAEYVTLSESADRAVDRFIKRLESPVLTDVHASWNGVPVNDILPSAIPDVFDETPVVIHGRYALPGTGQLVLSGKLGGKPWSQSVTLHFGSLAAEPSVPALWARNKVEALERSMFTEAMLGGKAPEANAAAKVALDFGIMSNYTSFVAVEPRIVNVGGKQRTVRVPVEMADGVNLPAQGGEVVVLGLLPGSVYATGTRPGSVSLSSAKSAAGYRRSGGSFAGGAAAGGLSGVPPSSPANSGGKARQHGSSQLNSFDSDAKSETQRVATKISVKLANAKGSVAIQVSVRKLDASMLAKLKKVGMQIDASDAGLKVVFGTIDAKLLKEIEKLDDVQRIDSVE